MLKNWDAFGPTRNLENLYSRYVISSAFLLGSPTFSSATSSTFASTCYERTVLHFQLHSEFAFQASPTSDCLLHLPVSCLCLSQLLQSSFCFNNRNLFLSAALPLVRCRRTSRKKLLPLVSSFYRKDFIKISSNWKNHRFSCGEIQGVAMLTLFFFNTVPPRGCHSHPDLLVSSLFPWKFMLRLPHFNIPLVFS